ncbi:MAG TPA: haloacid dehalogenase-like hydrolase [Anaerolineales bacterium]|nr:haloacid dehalogenase-like hydrolase [Anaerolineales bacterium]
MIVVSDMMGTLTTGSSVLGFVDWIRHNQSRTQARWLMAKITPAYLLAKAGLIDAQRWKLKLMLDSLTWLKEVDPEKFAGVAEWTVEHNLWPRRRADGIAILTRHLQSGAQVTIASSVYEPVALAFASRFGAQAIGTPVQFNSGKVTLAAGLVASEKKIQEVLSRLDVTRVDYAYGDTYMDIPLLESADHPVAVYPDKRLHATARERGWDIFGVPQ